MQAVQFTPGGPDQLFVAEVPLPEPNENEVRIKVYASAINRADTIQVTAYYINKLLMFISVFDFCEGLIHCTCIFTYVHKSPPIDHRREKFSHCRNSVALVKKKILCVYSKITHNYSFYVYTKIITFLFMCVYQNHTCCN